MRYHLSCENYNYKNLSILKLPKTVIQTMNKGVPILTILSFGDLSSQWFRPWDSLTLAVPQIVFEQVT